MYTKYFTSIFKDKKVYGLSQYNVEVVCTSDEIMSGVRLEESERNIIFLPNEAKVEIFRKNKK